MTQTLTILNPDYSTTIERPLFLSKVPAGFPSPADDYMDGKLDLNQHLIKHKAATFFVRVTGESMLGAGIHDGDLLIVDRALEPKENGGNCTGCEWISAVGEIDESTPKKFEKFAKEHPYQYTVFLHSPGGNLMAGMQLGRLIRKYNYSTSVGQTVISEESIFEDTQDGICFSSCAYAFLGGVSRSVYGDNKLGFHQFYRNPVIEAKSANVMQNDNALSHDQLVSSFISAYIGEMGIDARVLILAALTGKDEMLAPSPNELRILNITTDDSPVFTPWVVESFGNGLRYTQKAVNFEPQLSTHLYCKEDSHSLFFVFDIQDRQDMNAADIKSAINKVSMRISDKPERINIDTFDVNKEMGLQIVIQIPDKVKEAVIQSNGFEFEIDTPHFLFDTFYIEGGITIDSETKNDFKLVLKNCI